MIKLKSNALEYMQMLITLFNNNNDKINTETFFHLLKKYIKKSIGKKHVDEKTIYDSIEKEIVSFSFSFFKED
jgi:ABC-type microcin C transport system permease subunit YejB